MIGKKKYEPKMMYTITLEELVPGDHFYRSLDKALDMHFIYKECEQMYGKTGNPSIDPVVFFKMILFGYFENIISDRELVRRTADSLAARLYLGYDIDEELPWHSTISRTRAMMAEEVFEKLFHKILQMCIEKGLVGGEHQSIDSTLVNANASLEKIEKKMPQLELTKYIEETRKENRPEATKDSLLTKEENKQNEEEFGLQLFPIEEKKEGSKKRKSCSNEEYVSKTDPDSRIARKPGKLTNLYYSTHYSVDSKANIITDALTKHADKSDSETLIEVVNRTQERLNNNGLSIKSVGADKNYCSGNNLRELEQKAIEPFIPSQKHPNTTGGIDKNKFEYDKTNDVYVCPTGQVLSYRYTTKREAKVNSVTKKECLSCPIKNNCSSGQNIRRVQHSVYLAEYERLSARIKTPKGKRMKRLRQINTEPLFAEAKMNHGLSKFMTRGIEKARKNSYAIASVQNLKRLMKLNPSKRVGEQVKQKIESLDLKVSVFILQSFSFSLKTEFCFV